MTRTTRNLTYSEVTYKLFYVPELRELLPEPSERVIIIDADGQTFDGRMHAAQPRIGVPIAFFQKHNPQVGQTMNIEVKPNETATVHIDFEAYSTESPDPTPSQPVEPPGVETYFITASLESMLEDFIVENLSALEPNLHLFRDEDGVLGRQYRTEVGTLDLLCEDNENNLVVIELKRGRESDKVVGQISRYIGWVKAKIAGDSRDVRGIIILHKPTDKYPKDIRLEYAVLANPKIKLRYYEISLNFLEGGVSYS
jgi:RecB family endonuclease NucS